MKLYEFIDSLCEYICELSGCNGCYDCPHNGKCDGTLFDEIKEKGGFELKYYKDNPTLSSSKKEYWGN